MNRRQKWVTNATSYLQLSSKIFSWCMIHYVLSYKVLVTLWRDISRCFLRMNVICYNRLSNSNSKLTVCFYHVMCTFQIESTLYSCLNVNEPLARNRRDIWNFSDWNGIRTHNHLAYKRTLNHLAKLAKLLFKWLSCAVSTYMYDANRKKTFLDCTQQTFVLMKTSFIFRRRLQDVLIKTSILVLVICLQDVFKTS